MVAEYQLRVTPQTAHTQESIIKHLLNTERIKGKITDIRILKRSIDARQRQIYINLTIRAFIDEPANNDHIPTPITYPNVKDAPTAIVVGAGPAGLFTALRLIELGVKPIILERGKDVNARRKDLADISKKGIVDADSNYCFGEGGAGAYSDGKLYTRSKKRGSINRILNILHQHGAKEDILIDAHPHIGSDKLPRIIENIRNTILNSGGEVHFNTRVTDLIVNNNQAQGVITADGTTYAGAVILATGHSARDIYTLLNDKDIELTPKTIAVGVRLEHPQQLIDQIQYHNPNGRGEYLPAAEYSYVTQVDGRGVYSFCMCPGGFIVPAASAAGELVVNGMSPANRGTYWANSGMVVEVTPEDITNHDDKGVLKMMAFQQELEQTAYCQAGNTLCAGAQRMLDFVQRKPSKLIPPSSYAAGVQPSRLDQWLPPFISNRLRQGFIAFDRKSRGFLTNQAIMIGVETRTSSPVRIPRDRETLTHTTITNLYPCGEGAGYAGGIVSAAIDGERCAEALAATLHK
ncbi:MAG: FAD-binding protein [Bacteroidales bacterium]